MGSFTSLARIPIERQRLSALMTAPPATSVLLEGPSSMPSARFLNRSASLFRLPATLLPKERRLTPECDDCLEDEDLVVAALLGSMTAFDALVRRYRAAVTLVAEQVIGRRDAAEDVAQEAFLLAFKALNQLEDPTRFAAWLCAITRHRARRVASRESRSSPTEEAEMDRLILRQSEALTPGPEEQLLNTLEQAAIRAALGRTPVKYRLVVELYYYREWTVREIAGFLSLPLETVKWRLRQARELVRRQLLQDQLTLQDQQALQNQKRLQNQGRKTHGKRSDDGGAAERSSAAGKRRLKRHRNPKTLSPAEGDSQHREGGGDDGVVEERPA